MMNRATIVLVLFSAGCTALFGDYPGPRSDGGIATDAGADGVPDLAEAPSVCPNANVLGCQNFEFALTPTQNIEMMSATALVDNTRPFRGARSFHVMPGAGPGEIRGTFLQTFFAQPISRFWVRAWMQLSLVSPALPRVSLFNAPSVSLIVSDQGSSIFSGMIPGDNEDNFSPATMLTANQWHCVEWGVEADATTLLIDGVQIGRLPESFSGGVYNSVSVGLIFDGVVPPSGVEAWFDEVVVSDTPFGCAQ